jgi:hypothetical protein
MSLASFLNSIRDGTPVTVPPQPGIDPAERAAVTGILHSLDAAARPDIAHDAPPLLPDVALWAAERLYRACQFLVYRDVNADDVRASFAVPCPQPPSPAVCYSADLVLRHHADVHTLARGVARDDPLVDGLLTLARTWPLSSVGIPEVGKVDASAFVGHPGLRRLYADRIIERNDRSRLDDPAVLAAVREALGAFPSLAPGIWAAIAPEQGGKELEETHA